MKILNLVLCLLLCFSLATISGCGAAKAHPQHPGAVSAFDSTTYDVLLSTQTVIDVSRDQFARGVLSEKLKPVMNEIVKAYDNAMPLYKVWHTAAAEGRATNSQLADLNAALLALNTALRTYRSTK